MFGTNGLGGGLSFSKFLGGISKTLGIVNQVIPLYKEAKPMINNARNALNLIKEFSNTTTTRIINNKNKNMEPIKQKIKEIETTNGVENKKGPTFFL